MTNVEIIIVENNAPSDYPVLPMGYLVLGRQYNNDSNTITVVRPDSENKNSLVMIVAANNKTVDNIPVDASGTVIITSNLTQYSNITIGFTFFNETGYIKNSEPKQCFFLPALKPFDFVPVPPASENLFFQLQSSAFTSTKIDEDTGELVFYNINGAEVDRTEILSGGGTVDTVARALAQTANNNVNELTPLVQQSTLLPEFDASNYRFTFRTHAGEISTIDLPIESLAQGLDFDPITNDLILTRQDESELRIPLTGLIDVYTGGTSAEIQVLISNENVITANILGNSITFEQLNLTLREVINNKADKLSTDDQRFNGRILSSQGFGGITMYCDYIQSYTGKDIRLNKVNLLDANGIRFANIDEVGAGGMSFQGAWISGTVYQKGDVVNYSNINYVSTADNNTTTPNPTSGLNWANLNYLTHALTFFGTANKMYLAGTPVFVADGNAINSTIQTASAAYTENGILYDSRGQVASQFELNEKIGDINSVLTRISRRV